MIYFGCPYSNTYQNPIKQNLGHQNIMAVHQTSSDFVAEHTAPFSIKYVLKGSELYNCEHKTLNVDKHKFLIINKNQAYSSLIDEKETTSVCLFFSDQFISDVCRDICRKNEYQLDTLAEDEKHEMFFYQNLYWKDEKTSFLLNNYYQQLRTDNIIDPLKIDDLCFSLITEIIGLHKNEQNKCNQISAIKKSTRIEIYKRLSASIDFMQEFFSTKISLKQLSQNSHLSTYHYLRLFKETFKCSPYQYLTRIRLEHSVRLLKSLNDPLYVICNLSGFENESSFIRLFKKHYLITPQKFRALNKN